MSRTKTILIVLTSHAELGNTGRPTGFYLPEVAHPWKVFTEAGHRVDLASPKGGRPPASGVDTSDPVQKAFLEDPEMSAKLENTLRPEDVDPAGYDAVFFAGGHGTMWDFADNEALAVLGRDVYEAGGVVAALCHGPAALVGIRLSDGRPLVEGKRLTAFTNNEEAAIELTDVVPFALQTALEDLGAKHDGAANFSAHAVVDGRLVTGQNPASATDTALATVLALAGA
ncbi:MULTISPECIES: type 1 glutamine amidotransferase domain-containing protein [unclassified Streptomyces]|uniref:type 1 glutamine amidotransferase domain-containing protein n=1 Tax=unclassified Streptomyces TaxID=2593676 RepID=UPI001BE7EC84|nr:MULTISPECIES: type 1 glutamine amidotransferase domain-containing protein [unclassified Streptomyces]MBT2405524.1 type 1 glutamine amidotransferase domain-containing protein [Streptomyces sp. ISL-21]MBT2607797.1 type 1 glutamine amidotransferase domain-containing protein [Streptomyces sp. ISL-87]